MRAQRRDPVRDESVRPAIALLTEAARAGSGELCAHLEQQTAGLVSDRDRHVVIIRVVTRFPDVDRLPPQSVA